MNNYQLTIDNYQLPEGYKQTEVGVIPEDWEVYSLDLLSKLSSGTTPSRSQEDRYYRNGEYHWVKTTDLNNSRITTTEERVTKAALDETCLQIYPPGTVFVAMYGGFNQIGRTGLLAIPAAVNQALVAIQTKSNKLDPAYLLATLNYRVEHWKSVASSSRKDPNITSQDVRNFILPLPSVEEQRSIATTLSDVDALIASLDKLIAKKQAIKTATMQQLLTGKKRLPGFGEGKGYKKTEVGVIPEDWEVRPLLRAVSLATGQVNPRNEPYKSMMLIAPDHIESNTGRLLEVKTAHEQGAISGKYLFEPGDIVYSKIRPYLRKAMLANFRGLCSADMYPLTPVKAVSSAFIFAVLLGHRFSQFAETVSARSGIPKINREELGEYSVALPPLAEQQSIATVLSDMDAEIAALEARRAKTQAIKQGMMQELLTGRTRLV